MSQSSQLNNELQRRFIAQRQRKSAIQVALMRLKKKNQSFLESLQTNTKWRKIYNGLLFNNVQSQLSKLINLQLCEANDQEDRSFFNPFEKIPITMCYNKINKKEVFEEHAIYNLVLHYDSKTKRDMNWNNIEQTSKSTVRALHISGICSKNDEECFQRELEKRVLQKERFKGKKIDFKQIYDSGVADMTPISQISYN